ncbi:MAG: hydrolase [Gammaproteobacteria bacterium]|nr:hydrolase [Gammaproteobacteria bacterium]
MPVVDSGFRPAWWLRGDHAQTLWPALFRRQPAIDVDWERLELDDGDFLDLAWSGPQGAAIVLLLHGLQGGIDSHYARGIMRALNDAGFRVCLMHFRGCGREPNRLPISYHSGKTDDPQRVVEHVERRYGQPPWGAVGVSLGGNVLLKWLGERGGGSPLRRAVAISVPFLLDAAARRMARGLSRLYQRHLVGSLQASYRAKFARIPSPLDVDVDELDTFHLFDDQVTAALHGFAGVDDYYTRCSSRQYLPGIRVPTLILHARNDPFMFRDTPPEADELPDAVTLEVSDDGGHVGFIEGRVPGLARYYADRRVAEWIAERDA